MPSVSMVTRQKLCYLPQHQDLDEATMYQMLEEHLPSMESAVVGVVMKNVPLDSASRILACGQNSLPDVTIPPSRQSKVYYDE